MIWGRWCGMEWATMAMAHEDGRWQWRSTMNDNGCSVVYISLKIRRKFYNYTYCMGNWRPNCTSFDVDSEVSDQNFVSICNYLQLLQRFAVHCKNLQTPRRLPAKLGGAVPAGRTLQCGWTLCSVTAIATSTSTAEYHNHP